MRKLPRRRSELAVLLAPGLWLREWRRERRDDEDDGGAAAAAAGASIPVGPPMGLGDGENSPIGPSSLRGPVSTTHSPPRRSFGSRNSTLRIFPPRPRWIMVILLTSRSPAQRRSPSRSDHMGDRRSSTAVPRGCTKAPEPSPAMASSTTCAMDTSTKRFPFFDFFSPCLPTLTLPPWLPLRSDDAPTGAAEASSLKSAGSAVISEVWRKRCVRMSDALLLRGGAGAGAPDALVEPQCELDVSDIASRSGDSGVSSVVGGCFCGDGDSFANWFQSSGILCFGTLWQSSSELAVQMVCQPGRSRLLPRPPRSREASRDLVAASSMSRALRRASGPCRLA
mmetsp:Transcript_40036/g.125299  ORF Transcript_40036/g.125299 Transcript_40036/m.125299 type:complete len:338 (-) Transcript_40036:1187-2200(-)